MDFQTLSLARPILSRNRCKRVEGAAKIEHQVASNSRLAQIGGLCAEIDRFSARLAAMRTLRESARDRS
jgi:hypothetical protein